MREAPTAMPDGYIETVDPETGELDFVAVGLPPGATPDSLGLTTFVAADKFDSPATLDDEDDQ